MRLHPFLSALLFLSLGPAAVSGQTFRSSQSMPMAGFGVSVAVGGNEVFVGRLGAELFSAAASEVGAVHIYRPGPDGVWAEAAALAGTDTRLGDEFGYAIAVDGPWLAVGAPKHGGGTVYLFQLSKGTWVQSARLDAPDSAAATRFGHALALKGGVLLVGAPGSDSLKGAVYASRRTAAGWSSPSLAGTGTVVGGRLGSALAFDGTRMVAGAPGVVLGGAPADRQRGLAVVYRQSGAKWLAEATLEPTADSVTTFGASVLIDGNRVLVGAPMTRRAAGDVYVYGRDGQGNWTPSPALRPSVPDSRELFGWSLASAGGQLLVGAPLVNGLDGKVYSYRSSGTAWVEGQQLVPADSGYGSTLGYALAVSGDLLVVGGPHADSDEGKGFIYRRDAAGTWIPVQAIFDVAPQMAAVLGEHKCDSTAGGFSCQQVDLLSFLPRRDIGARRGTMLNDTWGWTDPQTKREYALVGRTDGTSFVDVTNPANATYLGDLPMHAGATPGVWRDIKVYHDHAFIVADGSGNHGVQVFDLTELRQVSGAPVTFTESAHYAGVASAHNIAINEATGFAYVVGANGGGETCGGALHMLDIRDPGHPVFAGCYADSTTGMQHTGYTHDTQCVTYAGPDTRFHGREICFNASETAIGISDVTDKAHPKSLATASYPNTAYAHQGWLSEDQAYFYLDDEGDEVAGLVPKTRTLVWDMKKLDEPVMVTEFLGTNSASDHNQYVRGHYLFQSNYASGLRVLDIADPVHPREVGYFDTVMAGDNVPGFVGSWSNYPYFPSGTIVVSSIREGLFVVRHRPEPSTP